MRRPRAEMLRVVAHAMRIFVVGASGVLGRALLSRLCGHEVLGTTRSPERAAAIAALGAHAVVCDVYDAGALRAAVIQARPDIVLNALTALSAGPGPANARIRSEGGPVVVEAARAGRSRRLIVESIAFASSTSEASRAAVEALERGAFESGLEAVILRFGRFWGPGTWSDAPAEPPAVHIEEAARRTVELLTAPPGRYEVVDPSH
jgi:nucleoside-diphosphate-sugar epimerase